MQTLIIPVDAKNIYGKNFESGPLFKRFDDHDSEFEIRITVSYVFPLTGGAGSCPGFSGCGQFSRGYRAWLRYPVCQPVKISEADHCPASMGQLLNFLVQFICQRRLNPILLLDDRFLKEGVIKKTLLHIFIHFGAPEPVITGVLCHFENKKPDVADISKLSPVVPQFEQGFRCDVFRFLPGRKYLCVKCSSASWHLSQMRRKAAASPSLNKLTVS
ncbi:MAG TPA: hypothetical protein VHZ50_06785 [Puia sp.]|nr:hypothetical protein [Puia sp.]